MTTQEILAQAAAARRVMAVADTAQKNRALAAMGEALLAHTPQILAANEADLEAAIQKGRRCGMKEEEIRSLFELIMEDE